MPLPVSVKLSSIYCRDEADGIGDAEPYLWTIFFKIDGETIRQAPGLPLLVGDAVFHFGPGSHGNLGTRSVDAGETVQIPAAIGEWHTGLQPIILTQDSTTIPVPGIVGAVAVLMEEDNVSDSGAEKGHQALNNFVRDEINEFIHTINLLDFIGVENPQDKLNELIEALKKKIQDGSAAAVSKAIEDAQGFWSNLWSGINKDDKIGSVAYTFSQQDIVQRRYTISLNQRWRNGDGDWEMFGVISAPDPCLSPRVAVNQQKATIRQIEDQIRALRAEMLHASVAMRAQLRAEIAELEAQLVPLRAELQRLQTLLDRCYLRQSVIPDIGAVLVNA
jgi:hypothetical protein